MMLTDNRKLLITNMLMLSGILAGIGILFPYLGRAVDLGIHARIWAGIALVVAGAINFYYKDSALKLSNKQDVIVLLLFFVCCMIFSTHEQLSELIFPSLSGDYSVRKLSILFYAAILPAILVKLITSFYAHQDVFKGILAGFIIVSIIAGFIVIGYWDYIYMATNKVTRELRALNEISTIGLSLVFSIAYFSVLVVNTSKRSLYLGKLPLLLLLVFMIIILRQRTHLILIILLTVPFLVSRWNKKEFFIICSIIFLIVLAVLLSVDFSSFSDSKLSKYWLKVVEGNIFDTRIPIYKAALEGIMQDPWGHGFAAFSIDYPMWKYPHNPILEAFYEIGILGGLIMGGILTHIAIRSAQLYYISFKRNDKSQLHFAFGSILILLLLHQLKAGGIESMGLLVIVWFLANALWRVED